MSEALDLLLQDGVIEAVLGRLKTGKEAEVWLVQHSGQIAAAKVYKERDARSFRNNVGYREGRDVRNSRTRRAIAKGSKFGQQAADEAWKSAEADTLEVLYGRGVRVPTPYTFYEGVLVMELVVDAQGQPAPRLVEAPPQTREEARAMYFELRGQIVKMLCADLIHGDLSAYNVLAGAGGPTIIDFPQTLVAARNNQAEGYFRRDVENLRTFFAGIDPGLHELTGDASSIWNAYVRRELSPDFVPRGGRDAGARPRPMPAPFVPRQAPEERERSHSKPLDPEAELRELEAKFLRQGGGERGRPPAAPPERGPRRGRRFGGGGGFRPGPPGQRGPGGPRGPGGGPPGGQRGPGGQQGGQRGPGGQQGGQRGPGGQTQGGRRGPGGQTQGGQGGQPQGQRGQGGQGQGGQRGQGGQGQGGQRGQGGGPQREQQDPGAATKGGQRGPGGQRPQGGGQGGAREGQQGGSRGPGRPQQGGQRGGRPERSGGPQVTFVKRPPKPPEGS